MPVMGLLKRKAPPPQGTRKTSLESLLPHSRFSMGSKRDKISPSERNTKLKRSFRGKPAAPKKLTLTE